MKTAAIIVAGGKGLRFEACLSGKEAFLPARKNAVRKQYVKLRGKPVLWWSLQAFQKSPSIDALILVVPRDDVQRLKRLAKRWRFSKLQAIVAGGAARAGSVQEGLKALDPSVEWVAIHDAVRPLVHPELIEEILRQAKHHRAAIAACPSKDTVKIGNGDGFIHETPDRKTVWLAQTPQIFERRLLEKAHGLSPSPAGKREKVGMRALALTPALSRPDSEPGARRRGMPLHPKGWPGRLPAGEGVTDDAQLVERLGVKVRLVESPPENLKITRPIDLALAEAILCFE